MGPMHIHSLKLLRPMVWEDMHLQEKTLFDLDLKRDRWARTDRRIDGRRTDFGTKLIYPFFLKKKIGYNYTLLSGGLFTI